MKSPAPCRRGATHDRHPGLVQIRHTAYALPRRRIVPKEPGGL